MAHRIRLSLAIAFAAPPAALLQEPAIAVQPASDVLPPSFRGTITYTGSHQGTLIRGRGTQNLGGSLSITLMFDGNQVTARYSGTGGINSGTMTGTRTGSRCRLIDDRGGDVVDAECTSRRFLGMSRQRDRRQTATVRLDARATTAPLQTAPARYVEQRQAQGVTRAGSAWRLDSCPASIDDIVARQRAARTEKGRNDRSFVVRHYEVPQGSTFLGQPVTSLTVQQFRDDFGGNYVTVNKIAVASSLSQLRPIVAARYRRGPGQASEYYLGDEGYQLLLEEGPGSTLVSCTNHFEF